MPPNSLTVVELLVCERPDAEVTLGVEERMEGIPAEFGVRVVDMEGAVRGGSCNFPPS